MPTATARPPTCNGPSVDAVTRCRYTREGRWRILNAGREQGVIEQCIVPKAVYLLEGCRLTSDRIAKRIRTAAGRPDIK